MAFIRFGRLQPDEWPRLKSPRGRAAYRRLLAATWAPVRRSARSRTLDIQPTSKVIEIGGIWFAPKFARTRGATEALFLMLAHANVAVLHCPRLPFLVRSRSPTATSLGAAEEAEQLSASKSFRAPSHKYPFMETKMHITGQPNKTSDALDAQRAILTKSIDEIAGEIGIALKECRSTFSSLHQRSDKRRLLWRRLRRLSIHPIPIGIVRRHWCAKVLARWVGSDRLVGRPLVCAVANAARISASELANDDVAIDADQ